MNRIQVRYLMEILTSFAGGLESPKWWFFSSGLCRRIQNRGMEPAEGRDHHESKQDYPRFAVLGTHKTKFAMRFLS